MRDHNGMAAYVYFETNLLTHDKARRMRPKSSSFRGLQRKKTIKGISRRSLSEHGTRQYQRSMAALDLVEKVEAALIRQVSEVANQDCDRMLVARATMSLKDCNHLRGPGNVARLADYGKNPKQLLRTPTCEPTST